MQTALEKEARTVLFETIFLICILLQAIDTELDIFSQLRIYINESLKVSK